MSTAEDLVSGLLSAIEQREATAREAAKYSSMKWETVSSAVVDLGGDDLDGLLPVPASPIGHLMVENDPESVLRLCRAHRDVIDEYRQARAAYFEASEKRAKTLTIWPSEEAELESRVMVALARLQPWEVTLKLLARGYGLKTEENSDG